MADDEHFFAYAGKILRVNLTSGEISTEPTTKYAKEWLGASGIAIKILYDELRSWVTPYEPANKLIFGAGALVGTTAPGACKSNISTLGPVTGGWASGCSDSYVGGQLKYAGYDSIVIEGKAPTPVYLWIHVDHVKIRDASGLWGKTTWETHDMVRQELRDSTLHVVSIGPAGENLVRGACVVQDKGRAFGRCGIGAVMGSKNLKAIVAKGTGAVGVAQSGRFMDSVREVREMFKNSRTLEGMRRYGTLGGPAKKQKICGISYKNFQECVLPDDMAQTIDPRKTIDGLKTEAPQMETMGTIQGRLAIREPTFMFKAHAYCNQMGLDVDAAGGPIGWAMECYQRGIIDERDADGLKLNWGDAEVALELIRKISYREGFGNILAEGSARAAEIIGRGSEYYAMHIKGQDLYEPCRGALAWCLGATTSTRGGGHTTGAVADANPDPDVEKGRLIFGVDSPYNPLEYKGRAKMVTYMETVHRVNNCLGICHMNTIHWDLEHLDLPHLAELYSAATGWETSVEDLNRMAMRQLNLEKAFNLRHTDFDRKDDLPTPRDLSEPIPTGDLAGWKMDEEEYNRMLDEYYDLHGWDSETSFPTRKTLVDLGLEKVADDLERLGKLGSS